MPGLTQLFDAQREPLHHTLSLNRSPESVVQETRRFLDSLRFGYAEQPECSELQRRLLPFVMDTLKATLTGLVSASEIETWRRDIPPASRHRALLQHPWLRRGAQLLLVLLLTGELWDKGAFFGFLLLLALIGMALAPGLRFGGFSLGQFFRLAPQTPALESTVRVNVADFLRKLADSLLTADKLLAEAEALHVPARHPIGGGGELADSAALLALMQDLLEAKNAGDSAYALKKAKTVPTILEQHGIDIQIYSGDNAAWFEFLPSLDPEQDGPLTVSPALTKNGKLLTPGRVTEPNL